MLSAGMTREDAAIWIEQSRLAMSNGYASRPVRRGRSTARDERSVNGKEKPPFLCTKAGLSVYVSHGQGHSPTRGKRIARNMVLQAPGEPGFS